MVEQLQETALAANAAQAGAEPEPYASKLMVNDTMQREYFAIAPMVDVSDKYFRYFMRLLTRHAFLYTEMINENAVLHACQGRDRLISFSECEHPVVLQLGGSDPVTMGQAAKVAQEFGYDEVNVNCGCPSNKVVKGAFGAILMKDPNLVARIVKEMREQVTIPVTVKCRLGVDDMDSWQHILNFIKVVSEEGGARKFIIHARKAHLKGLNPKQNRTIPPLKYPWVFDLRRTFPHLNFVINGGFSDVDKVIDILRDDHPMRTNNGLEGCMSGRMAMNTPWECAKIDREIYGEDTFNTMTREEILLNYAEFAQKEQDLDAEQGIKLSCNILVRPIITLFAGEYQGVTWRKMICDTASDKSNAGQIKKIITEVVAKFKELNPEALASRNGEKVGKPSWQLQKEAKEKAEWDKMTPEQREQLQKLQFETQSRQAQEAMAASSEVPHKDNLANGVASENQDMVEGAQSAQAVASTVDQNGDGDGEEECKGSG